MATDNLLEDITGCLENDGIEDIKTRRREYDRDREDRHRRRSRSRSKARSENRERSRSRSRSKSKMVSGFDMAPPASALIPVLPAANAVTGLTSGTPPVVPGMFPNMLPLATGQPFEALSVMPQAMTQQSVATIFSQVMAAIGGNTASPAAASLF